MEINGFLLLLTLFISFSLGNCPLDNGELYIEASGIDQEDAEIGYFYDIRINKFLPISAIPNIKTFYDNPDYIETSSKLVCEEEYTNSFKFVEKYELLTALTQFKSDPFDKIGLGSSLSVKRLFFQEKIESSKSKKASFIKLCTSRKDEASLQYIKDYDQKVFNEIDATHMVVGIVWGGDILVSVESSNFDSINHTFPKKNFAEFVKTLALKIERHAKIDFEQEDLQQMEHFRIKFNSDFLLDILPQTFEEAVKFFYSIETYYETYSDNEGKGVPIYYIVKPLKSIADIIGSKRESFIEFQNINEDLIPEIMKIFDEINFVEILYNDMNEDVNRFRQLLSNNETKKFDNVYQDFKEFTKNVSIDIEEQVRNIIKINEKEEDLIKYLDNSKETCKSFIKKFEVETDENKETFNKLRDEIYAVEYFKDLNVEFVTKKNSMKKILMKNFGIDIYVLEYNLDSYPDFKSLHDFELIIKNHKDQNKRAHFVVTNTKIMDQISEESTIKLSKYRDGELIVDNYDSNLQLVWENSTYFSNDSFNIITGTHEYREKSFVITSISRIYINSSIYFTAWASKYSLCYFKNNTKTVFCGDFNKQLEMLKFSFQILTNPFRLTFKWVTSPKGIVPINAVPCENFNEIESYCGRMHLPNIFCPNYRGLIYVNIHDDFARGIINGSECNGTEFRYLVYY